MSAELFSPLDDVLSFHFLPALTGKPAVDTTERELFSLPAHHGGVVSLFQLFTFLLPFYLLVILQPL